jgi:hypothetical protein
MANFDNLFRRPLDAPAGGPTDQNSHGLPPVELPDPDKAQVNAAEDLKRLKVLSDAGPASADTAALLRPDALKEVAIRTDKPAAWLAKALAALDRRAFTSSELEQIKQGIEALQDDVRNLTELSRRQQEKVSEKFEEVQRGSERLGRKDWVEYAIGAATTLLITEAVPPLVLVHLGVKAIHALGHVLEGR